MSDVPTATTEADAEPGCVTIGVGGRREQRLSDAVAWREGAVYIVHSTEFDVMAEDEDFREAVDLFAHRVFEYAAMLAEVVEQGDATEEEERALATIAARVMPLLEASKRRESRRWQMPRLRQQRSGHWRHRGTQAKSSSQLSAA